MTTIVESGLFWQNNKKSHLKDRLFGCQRSTPIGEAKTHLARSGGVFFDIYLNCRWELKITLSWCIIKCMIKTNVWPSVRRIHITRIWWKFLSVWLPQTRSPAVEMEVGEGLRRTGAWSSTKRKNESEGMKSSHIPSIVRVSFASAIV